MAKKRAKKPEGPLSGLTRVAIRELLLRSDVAVRRALVVLYDRQTRDEKATDDTKHQNQRGFSCCHASRGSYYARWVLGGNQLTGVHREKARKIVLRYAGQLLDEAEQKAARIAQGCKSDLITDIAIDRGMPLHRVELPETVCPGCGMPKPVDGYCACRGYGD